MRKLVAFALIGAGAQLVDGSLGMAYGVTSTTLLVGAGTSVAVASASVHMAELGTTLVSGVAHHRFGNVDWRVVRRLAVPGAVGALLGATALSSLSTAAAKPWTALLLTLLGAYIVVRFAWRAPRRTRTSDPKRRMLMPLGAVAGFVDATGGGGWGPIATPTLLSTGQMEPRKVIGTVSTSEFLVALGASVGFLLGLGAANVPYLLVAMLLLGGIVAAPLSAWLVRLLPMGVLGVGVGGMVMLTNTRLLLNTLEAPEAARWGTYLTLTTAWVLALAWAARRHRGEVATAGELVAARLGAGAQEPGEERAGDLAEAAAIPPQDRRDGTVAPAPELELVADDHDAPCRRDEV